jgi:hypothetical protein
MSPITVVASGARVASTSEAAAATTSNASNHPVRGTLGDVGTESVAAYALAFVLTWLIETIVYLWAFRTLRWPGWRAGRGVGRALLLVLGLNVVTHPLLWLFTARVPGTGPLLLAEVLAVLVEGTILGLVLRVPGADAVARWGWSLLAALLANAVSLLVGLLAYEPLLRLLLSGVSGPVAGSSVCC